MPIAVAAATFVTVTLLTWVVLRPRENVVARRIASGWSIESRQERRLEGSARSRLIGPIFHDMGAFIARLLPSNVVRRIDHMLVMANQPMSLATFLALWGGSASLGIGLFLFLWSATLGMPVILVVSVALLMTLLFGLGPYAALRRRVRGRQRSIIRELPHALDLIVTCMEAGLGVDAAFAAVTERMSGPISQTLSHYLREVGLGRPRREALASTADRSGVVDLIRIAGSVSQAEEMGTTLGDVLRAQADELRLLRRQRAQEAAQRAPVWMTIPLVFCFLPAMVVVIGVPSLLTFLRLLGAFGLGTP
jgi:tight adherence protein C